jgi:membrane associated rhomboid family serine protease
VRNWKHPILQDPIFQDVKVFNSIIREGDLVKWRPLTWALIGVSIAVALHSSFGSDEQALRALFIAASGLTAWQELEAGEVWRLLTPIFIHFGLLHLLFNMLELWDLGREIEARKGSRFLGGFVVAVGVAGNVAQYLVTGPSFGGMSGVVYGLLAYIWIRNRLDADANYVLRQYDVIICIGWYVLCWTGLLGPIANWDHTAGLIGGLAWGYLETAVARSPGGLRRDRDALGRLVRVWTYIAVGCLIGAVVLVAQYQKGSQGCAGEEGTSPDQRIAVCSEILASTTASAPIRAQQYVDRGDAYWAKGQNDLAINDYDDAIALDPGNARALAGRGLAERGAGETTRGRADIDRARQINAGIGNAYPALRYWDMTDDALVGIDLQDSVAVNTVMREVMRCLLAEMPP